MAFCKKHHDCSMGKRYCHACEVKRLSLLVKQYKSVLDEAKISTNVTEHGIRWQRERGLDKTITWKNSCGYPANQFANYNQLAKEYKELIADYQALVHDPLQLVPKEDE